MDQGDPFGEDLSDRAADDRAREYESQHTSWEKNSGDETD